MRPPKLNKKNNVHLFKLTSGCRWSPGRLLVLNTTEWCLGAAEPRGIHRKSELPHPNLRRKTAFWGLKWLKWLNIKLWMVKYGEILVAKMANPSIFAPKNHHVYWLNPMSPGFSAKFLLAVSRYPVIKRGLLENIPFIVDFASYKPPQLVQGLPLICLICLMTLAGKSLVTNPWHRRANHWLQTHYIIYIYVCVCVCMFFFYLHVRIVKFNFWV